MSRSLVSRLGTAYRALTHHPLLSSDRLATAAAATSSSSSSSSSSFPPNRPSLFKQTYRYDSTATPGWHGTTILAVRRNKTVTVVGDGQVTMGSVVVKPNARKVRRLGTDKEVIAGFAGATADAMTLFERLETKIEEYPGQLLRSCVSLAKDWRMDKYLRRLDAMLLVCDKDISLYLSGTGDVLEPTDGVIGIGSGGSYAIAAAKALIESTELETEVIAKKSMGIAADMCIYTNASFIVENIGPQEGRKKDKADVVNAPIMNGPGKVKEKKRNDDESGEKSNGPIDKGSGNGKDTPNANLKASTESSSTSLSQENGLIMGPVSYQSSGLKQIL